MGKGKKEKTRHKLSKKSDKIDVKDGKIAKKPECPKCGPAVFLAEHKGRVHCGSCGYTKWDRSESATKENVAQEGKPAHAVSGN